MPDCFERLLVVELEKDIILNVKYDMSERCFHTNAFYEISAPFSYCKGVPTAVRYVSSAHGRDLDDTDDHYKPSITISTRKVSVNLAREKRTL